MKRIIILLSCMIVFACCPLCGCPQPGNNNIHDKVYVFEKAFYQELPDGTEIKNALLWEYRLFFGVVDQWQWYIEIEPSDEFRTWLIDGNAYDLTKIEETSEYRKVEDLRAAPEWFEVEIDTEKYDIYQSKDGRMRLFESRSNGHLYMTDFGIQ